MTTPKSALFDEEGYLLDPRDWDEALARQMATELSIELTPAHLEVIAAVRRYYAAFELSPAMRPLVKYLARELGPEKGTSIHLLQLFRSPANQDSPAKIVARLAGLPRPDHCL